MLSRRGKGKENSFIASENSPLTSELQNLCLSLLNFLKPVWLFYHHKNLVLSETLLTTEICITEAFVSHCPGLSESVIVLLSGF